MSGRKPAKPEVPINVLPRGWCDGASAVLSDDELDFFSSLLEAVEVPRISLFDQQEETRDDD